MRARAVFWALLAGTCVFVVGCQSLGLATASAKEPALPPPVVPEGWKVYEIEDAGFTIAAPEGWEFESVRGRHQLGGGLFSPTVNIPDGTWFAYGSRLDEKSLSEGGAGMIMIERTPADTSKSFEELAANKKKDALMDLNALLGLTPEVETETLELVWGDVYKVRESFGDSSVNITYYVKKDGKLTTFSFMNFKSSGQSKIPSLRIMETLRTK